MHKNEININFFVFLQIKMTQLKCDICKVECSDQDTLNFHISVAHRDGGVDQVCPIGVK